MRAQLVGVPGSHPVVSAQLMLRYKGIEFSRFDLPNISHKLILPLMRYRGSTVPVLRLDGRRISGTMRIARPAATRERSCPITPAASRRCSPRTGCRRRSLRAWPARPIARTFVYRSLQAGELAVVPNAGHEITPPP